MRTIEIRNMNTSIDDSKIADLVSSKENIEHIVVYMPHKLQKETYGTGYDLFKSFYQIGRDAVDKVYH